MIFSEIRRLYIIINVIFTYGLDELVPKKRLTFPWKIGKKMIFWIHNKHPNRILGERLRLALQELGPVWIKFAQMLSTRRDLFPLVIADQLAILQNQVQPFDGRLARKYIENSMGFPLETWFFDFQQKPLASASVAQVHTARLKKNGKEVVIKVIRPDILSIIKADMRLMYRLANFLPLIFPDSKRLRPIEVVSEYEKNLLDELNLRRETANAIQLRRNFDNSSLLYIPEIYPDYCSENMMVMERIYGIPINNIEELKKRGTNMKLLAERGVEIFFIQVFRDSFFHGDMHPGNIFVSYDYPNNPKYIGIDFGIVGSLSKEDKHYLAKNFIAFFNRDYRKIAELHIDSGWISSETNIEDFEFAIRTVFEPVFEKSLSEISFGHLLLHLFKTARRFNMKVQPQLILLQKTLLYIEGIGRQLYPQLNLWKTAKPFLEDWIKDHVGIIAMFKTMKERFPYWIEKFPELPDMIYNNFKQSQLLHERINRITLDINYQQIRNEQSKFLLGIGAILLFFGCFFLFIDEKKDNFLSIIFIILGIIIWIIGWKKIKITNFFINK